MSLPLGSLEVVVSTLRIDPRVSSVDAISNWIRGTLQVSEDSESLFCNGGTERARLMVAAQRPYCSRSAGERIMPNTGCLPWM